MEAPTVTTTPTSPGPSAQTILLLAKIGSMVVLGLGSLLLGMLPLMIGRCRVKKSENRRAITSVSSASTTLTSASTLTVNSHADSSQVIDSCPTLCFLSRSTCPSAHDRMLIASRWCLPGRLCLLLESCFHRNFLFGVFFQNLTYSG